jgi:hypothetical protein
MTRYVVAAHLAHLGLVSPITSRPVFVLSLMLAHTRASFEFAEAASVLAAPDECAALHRFTTLVDRDLGLGGAVP